jgi:hypothetical protein
MRVISQARFDALAAYCRRPEVTAISRELAWFEEDGERIIATLIIDTDGEFSGIMLARDSVERFRWVGRTRYFDNPEEAIIELNSKMQALLINLEKERIQGDESGRAVDFFTPIVLAGKLHPNFKVLASGDEFSAARDIISSMMRWHEGIDGNFVEQFQTSGFDARIWELYLFATLTEARLEVSHPKPAPDFLARGLNGEFAVEATTINPSTGVGAKPNEKGLEYRLHYLPIRYAGPLTTKLHKEYWKRPAVTGKPLVFAIQDFHDTMSMTYSGSALQAYLYGLATKTEKGASGNLVVTVSKIVEHRWGAKKVPSGFFSQPGSENVSAVVFNSSGTIAKFNRMGVGAGFGSDNVVLIRRGFSWDSDPDSVEPAPFMHFVSEGYPETWIEGMDVYHNPNALHPLDPELLPGAAHHRLRADGQIETFSVPWKPVESATSILALPRRDDPATQG